MKKEIAKVDFNFSYAYLKQLADSTLLLIDRDITQFTDRGFTPAKRTAFTTALAAFTFITDDETMLALKVSTTQAKDTTRDALETKMRTVLLAARKQHTAEAAAYREYGNPELSQQTDEELVRNAKIMKLAMVKYALNLANEGITAAKTAEFETLRNTMDLAIDNQTMAIKNRDTTAEARVIAANQLYALIVGYSETGRDIWYTNNEAKYNDYIIYNTPTGTPDDTTPPPPPPPTESA